MSDDIDRSDVYRETWAESELDRAHAEELAAHPESSTQDVRKRIDKPRNTVDRQLQALHMLDVATVGEQECSAEAKSRWYYSLADGIDPNALNASQICQSIPQAL